jgi:hypothetical protein
MFVPSMRRPCPAVQTGVSFSTVSAEGGGSPGPMVGHLLPGLRFR